MLEHGTRARDGGSGRDTGVVRLFVGLTDRGWLDGVRTLGAREVNLWRPHRRRFRALERGEPYLFRLHAPWSAVAGGGRFVEEHLLPLSLAWLAFGAANGVSDPHAFGRRFERAHPGSESDDPVLSCVILSDPFFIEQADWIRSPDDWRPGVAHGKLYVADEVPELRDLVGERLGLERHAASTGSAAGTGSAATAGRTSCDEQLGPARWRLRVVEAYSRRCAMTGERQIASLDVTHIRPPSQGGPQSVDNALCLRADLSRLFQHGLLTVDPERLLVRLSSRLRETAGELDGRTLAVLPERFDQVPSREALDYHASHVFRG